MHERLKIEEEHLHACLREQYDLSPVTLDFLPLGADYDAGVYHVVNEQGAAYLLKVTARPLYEPGFFVPTLLREQGITAVVAPVPTRSQTLWTRLGEWLVIVYPFLEGETSFTGMTSEQWKEAGAVFRQIHQVALPSSGFEMVRKETFDPTIYTQWVRNFEAEHLHAQHHDRDSTRALRTSWLARQSVIHTGVEHMEKLAEELKTRAFPYVICHADLHPANLLRDGHGRVFVIDWDEVMLAPKERDFIFIRQPQADAFWEGYGQKEIDWLPLTYYLWERVMQDLIEYARSVYFRDNWTEAAKAEVVRVFDACLADGADCLSAAYEASAHLAL